MTLELPSPQKGDGRGSFWGNGVAAVIALTSAAALFCQPFVCGNDFRIQSIEALQALRIILAARSLQSRCDSIDESVHIHVAHLIFARVGDIVLHCLRIKMLKSNGHT